MTCIPQKSLLETSSFGTGYFCLYLRFCLQIRSKVMTNCTDDQIKSLTGTNLILRKLICQTLRPIVPKCNTLYNLTPCLFTGVLVSCRQKLSSQSCSGFLKVPLWYRVTIRDFHEWHDTTLVSFFRSHSNQSKRHPVDRRLHYQSQAHLYPMLVAAEVAIASR